MIYTIKPIFRWVAFSLFILMHISTYAQDPHFSQYFSSPLMLNPSLTGIFPGDSRVSFSYRNQWNSVQYPYHTGTFSSDISILQGKIPEHDILAIGSVGFLDASNNYGLKVSNFAVSAAYHKSLDLEGFNHLGVGFMFGNTSTRLNYNRFVFQQQLTPAGYDPNLSNGEPIDGFTVKYMDASAGIHYDYFDGNTNFYIGAAIFHVNKPRLQGTQAVTEVLEPRISVNSGGSLLVGENNRLYMSLLYQKSEVTEEKIIGSIYGMGLNAFKDNTQFLLGGFYRLNESFAPYAGIQLPYLQAGISYDVNVSQLFPGTRGRGGYELSLSYYFVRDPNRQVNCFRF